jgi:hypothetical protein
MKTHRNTLLCSLLLACAATAARAQSLTIDDFTTGPVSIQFAGAKQTTDIDKVTSQKGSGIIGGLRSTILSLQLDNNPYLQNAGMQIRPATATAPAALVFGEGFDVDARIDMTYGYNISPKKQLKLDLTPYDRFRATFAGFNGFDDFVTQAYSGTDLGAVSEWACDVPATVATFTVDMPFANAVGNADLSKVTALAYVFQSSGQGGQDFGLTKLEAVTADTPPGDVTYAPMGMARAAPNRPGIAAR